MRQLSSILTIALILVSAICRSQDVEKAWYTHLKDAQNSTHQAGPVYVNPQGKSFVAGTLVGAGTQDLALYRLSTEGVIESTTRVPFSTTDVSIETPTRIQGDAEGNIYVGGTAEGNPSGTNFPQQVWVVKFSPEGAVLWQFRRTYDHFVSGEFPVDIAPSGNSYLCFAPKTGNGIDTELRVVKVSPEGEVAWEEVYNAGTTEGTMRDGCRQIVADPQENVGVIGEQYAVKISAAGEFQWVVDLRPQGYGMIMEADAAGAFFLGVMSPSPTVHLTVIKLSASGTSLWTRARPDRGGSWPRQLLSDGFGGCYLFGMHSAPNTSTIEYVDLIHWNATGVELWIKTVGPGEVAPNTGIARDGRGKCYWSYYGGKLVVARVDGQTGNYDWLGEFTGGGGLIGSNAGKVFFAGGDVFAAGGLTPVLVKFWQKPDAKADSYSAAAGQSMNISQAAGVSVNDAYSGNSAASIVTPPSAGQLTLNPNGAFNFTPPPGFTGEITFVYKLTKGSMSSANTPVSLRFHPALTALAVSPATLVGGNSTTGTVTIGGNAPSGGTEITLTDNTSVISMAPTVTVPGGATSASFAINTTSVSAEVFRQIFATRGAVTKSYTLKLVPANLSALSITPNTLVGGNKAVGKVELDGAASGAGKVVNLTDNTSAITVPGTVTVASTKTSANFTVDTAGVSASVTRQITATSGSVSRTANLTLTPAGLSTLTASPSSVKGGTNSTGSVKLTGMAAGAGITVALSDNTSVLSTPASVAIAAGQTTASFTIATSVVTSTVTRQVTATHNGVSWVANVTLTP